MNKLRKWVILTIVCTFATTSIQGQPIDNQDDSAYSLAYMESNQSAHWSAYIPIGVMVAAAIWFGIADKNHTGKDSGQSLSPSSSSRCRYGHYSNSGSYSH